MNWTQDTYYKALSARDVRFDGVFFVGVTSTRIYCRPICPARTPLQKNCTFHPSPAAAAQAGFRPCLRCRPELAPGRAPVDAVSRLARVAAERVDQTPNLAQLASDLGVSSRQLRRAFAREYGVSPQTMRTHRRLELAHRLLTESSLSITEVAFASGFGSLRRFHAAFKEHFNTAPGELKRAPKGSETVTLQLSYRPPLNWEALLEYLSPRLWPGVETIDGSTYRRTIGERDIQGILEVTPARQPARLDVSIPLEMATHSASLLRSVRRLFDLDCDPAPIAAQLQPTLPNFRQGIRVPGAFDNLELALRALLGQQISVKAATTIGGRLVRACGTPLKSPKQDLTHLFPSAEVLGKTPLEALQGLGLTSKRAASLNGLARAVSEGQLRLEPGLEMESQLQELQSVPGIGPWTAHYIAMRALGWPDAFPHQDLGLRKAQGNCTAAELLEASESWRPWRAYAAQHLWRTL